MSVYHIVFSPTGGTQKVSSLFLGAFGKESTKIDLCRRDEDFSVYSFCAEDICTISVPSYGGRVPAIAVSRLRQMKGNGARAILIAVYGNRAYEDTLAELRDVLTAAGFSCIAAVAAIAEHSIMRQFAAGRPDAQDAAELAGFANAIRAKIDESKAQGASAEALSNALSLPGGQPYREYGGVPMKPEAGNSCTRCGLCAQECPVGAIATDDPASTDAKRCISCMRCIAVCPQKARSVSKILLTAGSLKLKKACKEYKKNELFL